MHSVFSYQHVNIVTHITLHTMWRPWTDSNKRDLDEEEVFYKYFLKCILSFLLLEISPTFKKTSTWAGATM